MTTLDSLSSSGEVLFLLIGAVMIFAMHAGFAFLEAGSVRKKNQINALNKIMFDWAISSVVFFCVGYPVATGISFMTSTGNYSGVSLMKFFLHLGFAACIPAIISGGIAERSKFWTNSIATAVLAGLIYPFVEGTLWNSRFPIFDWLYNLTGVAGFADYAGSVVVHALGGWIALPAIILLGPRIKRYGCNSTIKVSSIPFLSLGSWILCVGWFGFNVMSAPSFSKIDPLVAVNSLMSMVGGIITGLLLSRNDSGYTHNGALAGLVAICAGSNLYHPLGALLVGAVAGAIFVFAFHLETEVLKIDDVLGVWPLHGLCGTWGGIAAGIFGMPLLGGRGGVNLIAQIVPIAFVIVVALLSGFVIYGLLKNSFGIRLTAQEEIMGSDLSLHRLEANPEDAM